MTRINERLPGKSNHSDELKLHSCQYMGFITVHMLYLIVTVKWVGIQDSALAGSLNLVENRQKAVQSESIPKKSYLEVVQQAKRNLFQCNYISQDLMYSSYNRF